ncbi:MAG: DNA-binding protein [Helicobacteraceae bacterium]|nr:DNA-binding protein [Helicobacteraceae bacterium]
MPKLTIMDAAQKLGVSKEAIHNRIRRGSLESVIEDGIKYVLLDESAQLKPTPKARTTKNSSQGDERYYKFLEEQNSKLQSRVEFLEGETRTLREQKELMLIQEREKIEEIYKQKDEQLKNILNAISSKFMLEAPMVPSAEIESIESVDAEIEEPKLISLKKYLKKKNYPEKKIKKIKAKFEKLSKKEERIICIDKKYYLDLQNFDYSDLIA